MAHRDRPGMGPGEVISFILLVGVLVMGVKYFFDYRHSAGYALSDYIGAIKVGDADRQYAMIDDQDKQDYFPTLKDYTKKAIQAHGYTNRVVGVECASTVAYAGDPNAVTVKATVSIHAESSGKEIGQTAAVTPYTDDYVLRKNAQGQWRVWLGVSGDHGKLNMLKEPPTPELVY